jgi:hypothetical protein
MKIKRTNTIILIIVLLFAFVLYKGYNYTRDTGFINSPNKINLYYNGNTKQIVKNSGITTSNSNDLFEVICKSIIFKMPDVVPANSLSETSNDIKEAKQYAVGFIYDKPQKLTISNNGDKEQVQYTEILFPLTEGLLVYVKLKNNSYLFVGVRDDISDLVRKALF